MVEDEVQDHEEAFDLRVTFEPAMLRSSQPDCRIHLFACEVIDKASLPASDALEMTERDSFAEEPLGDGPTLPLDEAAILPTQKVTGVQSNQIQESGLAFRVPHGLQHRHGIVIERHRSSTSRIM